MLNGIYYFFSNAWNGFKSLYVPPATSPLTEARNEIDQVKKEIQQLKAENNRLKNVEHDYQKSIREQAQEINALKASIASYKRLLEEKESLLAADKRRLEESEASVASYKRQLEESKPFLDVIEKNLTNLKDDNGLDYARTLDYIILSALRNMKVLTFKLENVSLEAGDRIFVCGGHVLLGDWVPTSSLELTAMGSNYEASVGINEVTQKELNRLQYKYALLRGDAWYWESGKDRFRENPTSADVVDGEPRVWETTPCMTNSK
ncbi:hypothetical protein K7432_004824 [Basidiobolus ranarum]|uniref:CBM20 domain-containing protein n=1 Tax=Basidiobolus ranarum TaxID=34480 RepID=A0ABR2W422_9FUNG